MISKAELVEKIWQKINLKTKPNGSLGMLEQLAHQIALFQNTDTPSLRDPAVVIFAGDHGAALTPGISAFPRAVTAQMVLTFLKGGAAINVFTRQIGGRFMVIDSGVDYDFSFVDSPHFCSLSLGRGTASYFETSAMTLEQCHEAIMHGREVIARLRREGTAIVMLGEMGIGNTASSSLVYAALYKEPVREWVGRGTGLSDEGLKSKTALLEKAFACHPDLSTPFDIVSAFGGFEIAMLIGAMLQAFEERMLFVVDGFIVTAAYALAERIAPGIREAAIFSHVSDEAGHCRALERLNAKPLLRLGLRLGEGTGAALAYPLISGAVAFLNEMASFEDAGVSSLHHGV